MALVNPKIKVSIEFSRSGYLVVTKAVVGGSKGSGGAYANVKQVRKDA